MEHNRTEEDLSTDDAHSDEEIVFLTLDQVIELHEEGIRRYTPNEPLDIHNQGMLESAVQTPQQTWGGNYLYGNIVEMAVAYLVGLACNHAFVNGNKRVGFMACSTFLRMNGYKLTLTENEASEMTLNLVTHELRREEVIEIISDSIEEIT